MASNIPEINFYMNVVKTRTLEAKTKAKARTLESEAKFKDMILCPQGSSRPGLYSRTTSLDKRYCKPKHLTFYCLTVYFYKLTSN